MQVRDHLDRHELTLSWGRRHPATDARADTRRPKLPSPVVRPLVRARAVLFDYGHTLVDFQRLPSALAAAYGDIRARLEQLVEHELPEAEKLAHQVTGAVDKLITESYFEGRLQELDIVELLAEAFAGIGITLGPELAEEIVAIDHRAFTESVTVPGSTIEVLETLQARGWLMGLVSNMHLRADLMQADLAALGLDRFLSATVFSSELGWRKPDARIFTAALQRLGVEAEEAVFVGDRLRDDIAGARAVGMRTVLTREFRDEIEGPDRADARRFWPTGEDIGALRADRTIRAFAELPDVLEGWGLSCS
jgi:HAD superfamily hydrolase (TIGR01509 family)